MRNKIKAFVDNRGITPIQLHRDTRIAVRTAYRLYHHATCIPTPQVMEKIWKKYGAESDYFSYIANLIALED